MSLKPDRGTGGSFQPAPEGTHMATCVSVIDLGMQETKFGSKRQVFITFEIQGPSKMDDGRPFVVSRTFTNSLHEKATLRSILEPWLGRREIDRETFTLSDIAGKPAFITVGHREGLKGTFAELMSVASLPQGIKLEPSQKPVNPVIVFDMDEPDMKLLESMPKWVRAKIEGRGAEEELRVSDVDYDAMW